MVTKRCVGERYTKYIFQNTTGGPLIENRVI